MYQLTDTLLYVIRTHTNIYTYINVHKHHVLVGKQVIDIKANRTNSKREYNYTSISIQTCFYTLFAHLQTFIHTFMCLNIMCM